MISRNQGPTRLLSGRSELIEWLTAREPDRVVVLVDAGVVETAWYTRLDAAVRGTARQVDRTVVTGAGSQHTVAALSAEVSGSSAVVAIGGGSLLDQAKLASLLPPGAPEWLRLTMGQRSGLALLPPSPRRPVPLVAVPTTLGTGAEVSRVACLSQQGTKRLVMSAALCPDAAVLDSAATATLPVSLVAEGVLEVLFRVVSPYLGDPAERVPQDSSVEAVAQWLVRLGNAVADSRHAGRPISTGVRSRIAILSGRSHAEWLHVGRPPFSVKGWLLANELSMALGTRKMPAVAALLPALWAAIEGGEARWGFATRLTRLWDLLRRVEPAGLPAEPSTGIAVLMDRWQIDRRLTATPEQIDAVCARTVRAWGAGLPMLGGLGAGDIREVLNPALSEQPAGLRSTTREIVRDGRRGWK